MFRMVFDLFPRKHRASSGDLHGYRRLKMTKDQATVAARVRADFDQDFYLTEYPDVVRQHVNPLDHYVVHGSKEGRRPTPDFDPTYYRTRNDVPAHVEPFFHYLTEGKDLGLLVQADDDFLLSNALTQPNGVVPARRPKNDRDFALAVPFGDPAPSTAPRRVAAVIHAFYVELVTEVVGYLDAVPSAVDLFLTTDTPGKADTIRGLVAGYRKGRVEVVVGPNRGRDIAPFVALLPRLCRAYDLVLHAHTKKSPHGGDALDQWRDYLLGNLLGSTEIVASIFAVFDETRAGLVFPQHLFAVRGILNWGFDFEPASRLMRRTGVKIDKDMVLEFPSGSMFWAKTDALRTLADLALTVEDFEVEAGQFDGTLAHAIERVLLMLVERSGFDWAKVFRKDRSYPHPECVLEVGSARDLASAMTRVYRPLLQSPASGTVPAERAFPETRPLIYHPSGDERPRINLLVPSINPQHVFGGIGTALHLFRAVMAVCGDAADFRIVTTDATVEKASMREFAGFALERLTPEDGGRPRVVVDTFHREAERLNLRRRDTFIATAWWTARFAQDARQAQRRFFGEGSDVVYLIQDYEPNFYGWGSRWVLAENTYKDGEGTVAILNSEELYAFFRDGGYRFKRSFYLPYEMNERLRKRIAPAEREKVILVYGRPSVTRNLYEILVTGLILWQRRNPTTAAHWRIVSAGEDYPETFGAPVQNMSVLGKLSFDEYAYWLNRASIGVSLMVSPHPSYPPLEMAEAGLLTITNTFAGKDLARRFPTIRSIETVDADTLSDAIEDCTARLAKGRGSTAAGPAARPADLPEADLFTVEKLLPFLRGLAPDRPVPGGGG